MTDALSQELRARQACSYSPDAYRATTEVAEAIRAKAADVNFLFVSSHKDLDAVARAWADADAGPTICCTTAGEIWSEGGHVKNAVVGASLSGVRAKVWPLEDLSHFDIREAQQVATQMRPFLDSVEPRESVFAVVVLDGLSRSEERVVASLHHALGNVPMVGGSAGDDLAFQRTYVLSGGRFRDNTGSIALIATKAPATTFMAHHFEPTGAQVVVTQADTDSRRVMELDGRPAVEVYRRAVGLAPGPLSKEAMAVSPFMLAVGGRNYVRSLAGEVDGALDLYCAIEEGLVLDIGRPTDLKSRLRELIAEIEAKVGRPQLVLGFDCILRRLEMELFDDVGPVATMLGKTPFCGFSTYGEVTDGLHVNQTLTGIAFGR